MNISSILKIFNIDLFKIFERMITSIFGSQLERDKHNHDANIAVQETARAEYTYSVSDRSVFDMIIDGINRLPRPLFALSAFYFLFVMPQYDPNAFKATIELWNLIDGFSFAMLSAIIGFFFVGRPLDKYIKSGPTRKVTKRIKPKKDSAFDEVFNGE